MEGLVYSMAGLLLLGQGKGLEESRVVWDVGLLPSSSDSKAQVRNSCHSLG